MNRCYALAACAPLILSSCGTPDIDESPPPALDRLEFKMVTKERTFEDCLAGADGCSYVRLDYPVLIDAPETYAVTEVTHRVFSAVNASYGDQEPYPSAESLMDAFIGDYRELVQNRPDYQTPWFLERKVFVLHNTSELVSLSISERTFTGGAQGLATLVFVNLDPRTGADVTLADVLVEDYESQLLPLAEVRFREVRGIEDGMSLADAGFTFLDGDVFALTDNVSIGEDGLTFYYNPYDVAPYALGSTEIVLSYDELTGLLKEPRK